MAAEREKPDMSLVIPVYNGSRTICSLVDRIQMIFANMFFEIVLVNDGSEDDSKMGQQLSKSVSSAIVMDRTVRY